MKRILVTGGAGFIGSHFIRYLLHNTKDYVINYDNLTYAGSLDNTKDLQNERYKLVIGDINNTKLLLQTLYDNHITHIVNFAAETHVDHSIYGGAVEFIASNTVGVMTLLNILRDKGKQLPIQRLIHISTDEVFGSLKLGEDKKFTEESPFYPSTPYAGSKAAGDMLARSYIKTFELPVIITHTTNNYGTHQYPEKLIPLCVKRIKEGQKLLIHGDGKHIRDWIHVEDNCSAIAMLLDKGELGEEYNIGANNEQANLTVMTSIAGRLGQLSSHWFEYVPDRPGNDRRYALDTKKIRALGWKPKHTKFWEELGKVIDWYA